MRVIFVIQPGDKIVGRFDMPFLPRKGEVIILRTKDIQDTYEVRSIHWELVDTTKTPFIDVQVNIAKTKKIQKQFFQIFG